MRKSNSLKRFFDKTRLVKDQMLDGRFPLSDTAAQSLFAVLLASQTSKMQNQFNVIDFGGACGTHYFQLRSYIPPEIRMDWIVVETTAMAKQAQAFETEELHFVDSKLSTQPREPRWQIESQILHSHGIRVREGLPYSQQPWWPRSFFKFRTRAFDLLLYKPVPLLQRLRPRITRYLAKVGMDCVGFA
jgi:hypothetical protein